MTSKQPFYFDYYFRIQKLYFLNMTGKMELNEGDESSQRGSTQRSHKSKQLEDALTAKQESEANVTRLDEKLKLYEAENAELKEKVRF